DAAAAVRARARDPAPLGRLGPLGPLGRLRRLGAAAQLPLGALRELGRLGPLGRLRALGELRPLGGLPRPGARCRQRLLPLCPGRPAPAGRTAPRGRRLRRRGHPELLTHRARHLHHRPAVRGHVAAGPGAGDLRGPGDPRRDRGRAGLDPAGRGGTGWGGGLPPRGRRRAAGNYDGCSGRGRPRYEDGCGVSEDKVVLGGRYRLGRILGTGGMAEVFLAEDTRLHRTVAVKVLRSDLARDSSFQERFRREAHSAAALNHPSIVAVYDTGEEQQSTITGADVTIPYIVMEYVQGRTLREVIDPEHPLPPAQAGEIMAALLSALEYSHRA